VISEELPQIGLTIFLLALLGYVAREFYNIGYYGPSYKPTGNRTDIERFLKYCSQGLLLILLGIAVYVLLISREIIKIPEIIQGIPVSQETASNLAIYSFLLAIITQYTLYIIFFSLIIGRLMFYGSAVGVIIEKNEESEPIKAREIYDEDNDFFYYLDLNGNWATIRKSLVKTMKYDKVETLFDEWIKKDKRRRYIIALILLIILIITILRSPN
jgi:hypothetical protein